MVLNREKIEAVKRNLDIVLRESEGLRLFMSAPQRKAFWLFCEPLLIAVNDFMEFHEHVSMRNACESELKIASACEAIWKAGLPIEVGGDFYPERHVQELYAVISAIAANHWDFCHGCTELEIDS